MFDIDKHLKEIFIKEISPSEDLINSTFLKCKDEINKKTYKQSKKKFKGGFFMSCSKVKRVGLIATPILAVFVIAVFLGLNIFNNKNSVKTYYTVDINPSVCIGVDENEVVREVTSQNDDAKDLLKNVDVKGKSADFAIGQIIEEAKDEGYIKNSEKYVLIGHFGEDNEEFDKLEQTLEEKYSDTVKLLIVSGSMDDKKDADSLDISAGMLKLSKSAKGVKVKKQDKVENVMNAINKKAQVNLAAPTLQAKSTGASNVKLSWNRVNFKKIGYIGKITYQIVIGDSEEQISQMNGKVLTTITFDSYGKQPLHYTVTPKTAEITSQAKKYFGIYAKFNTSENAMCSNVVNYVLNASTTSSKNSNSENSNNNNNSKNSNAPLNNFSNISGHMNGNEAVLSWNKPNNSNFKGYKVMYSFSNSRQARQKNKNNLAKSIANINDTSCSIDVTQLEGYTPGATCYFCVTACYKSNAEKMSRNVLELKIPKIENSNSTINQTPNYPSEDDNSQGAHNGYSKMGQN